MEVKEMWKRRGSARREEKADEEQDGEEEEETEACGELDEHSMTIQV
jgi:hypothetical protein